MQPLAIGLMAVGTLYSAYSQYQAGKAGSKIAGFNAALDDQAAAGVRAQAGIEADRVREEGKSFLSGQEAQYGAAGVVATSGSPLQVLIETGRKVEQDALNVRYGGNLKSQELRNRATSRRLEGKMSRRQGTSGAVGTLLSGAGQIAGAYAMRPGKA